MKHLSIAVALASGGCSIVYNPDKIASKSDAAIDAAIDADPTRISVMTVEPADLYEGTGDGGSRPAVLVIHGANFVVGATVQLAADAAIKVDVDNAQLQVSANHEYLAVPITAHVDSAIADGTNVPLTATVTQPLPDGTMVMKTTDGITLHGLDELTAPVSDWSTLKNRTFSQIALSGTIDVAVDAVPASPAVPRVLRSTSSISVGKLNAIGGAGSGSTGALARGGGCPGADGAGDASACGGGGGGASTALLQNAGGGGAGFATAGKNGTPGGPGGKVIGSDLISSLEANLAGGGGGGATILGTAGGGGGGGGGRIMLYADGDLAIGTADTPGGINLNGGKGDTGGQPGGGGAGGALILHAGGALAVNGPVTALGATGNGIAGDGSNGRIRWDAVTTNAAPTTMPAAVRGATLSAPPLAIYTSRRPLLVVGEPAHAFTINTIDDTGEAHTGAETVIGSDGTAMANVPWQPGWNHVCVVNAGGSIATIDATTCVDIAYLP